MRCSATSLFYQIKSCSGIWVRRCNRRTAYAVLSDPNEERVRVQRGESVYFFLNSLRATFIFLQLKMKTNYELETKSPRIGS